MKNCTKCNSNTNKQLTINKKSVCIDCLKPIKITDVNDFLNKEK